MRNQRDIWIVEALPRRHCGIEGQPCGAQPCMVWLPRATNSVDTMCDAFEGLVGEESR